CEDEMLYTVVAATLQDMQESSYVAVHIHVRILRRIAHTRLCGEIDHPLRLMRGESRLDRCPVGKISMDMGVSGLILESREPGLLKVDVIVVGHVVDADHFVAALEKLHRDVRADKPGCS